VTAVVALIVGLVIGGALLGAGRVLLARRRWRRRISEAEREVADAVQDGRMAATTGEAVLQHLEGLRRDCGNLNEGD
jgi:hypothetical protein